jgi:hypothetical protein
MLVYAVVQENKKTGAITMLYHTAWRDEKLAIKEARGWNKSNMNPDTFYHTRAIHIEV